MSSFSDNFKRDEEEDMLEYDDSAFYFFSIAVLSAIVVPMTWSILSLMIWGDVQVETISGGCQCVRCKAMLTIKKKQARSKIYVKSFYFRVFVAGFFWYIWYLNAQMVQSIENLQSFDPFAILQVENEATIRDIKKSYRRLSLEMHPDKNPENPLAVQEFIRLTKAYNILTDETAYDNFKKYGNPDGPGSYSVAIALPRFLLETDNQIPVLLCAFFILLIVIPGFLYMNFGDTTTKDEMGVLLENKRLYGAKLNENLLPKNVPLILAASREFQAIGAKNQAEVPLLKKLKQNEDIDELLPKVQSRNMKDMNMKPLLLILGYLMKDENIQNPIFKEGLNQILKEGVFHINMMIDVAMEINAMARMSKSVKKLGWKAIQSLVHFQQFFVQGLWSSNDPMLQLPGMDTAEIKAYRKKLREHQIPDGKIETFCRLSTEQRAKLNLFAGDKAKNSELEKVIKALPLVTVSNTVEVEGEATITASDIISFEIKITYDNLSKDQCPGYVCSKSYPFIKKSNWYIVIVDAATKENVVQIERIQAKEGNTCKFDMKQRFGRAGKFAFHCYVCNDSYVGFDKEMAIEVEVLQDDPARVVAEYSKEDLDAVKGPGVIQAMMAGEEEEDSDSSDDNPEELLKKLEQAGIKAPEAEKIRAAKEKHLAKEKAESQLMK